MLPDRRVFLMVPAAQSIKFDTTASKYQFSRHRLSKEKNQIWGHGDCETLKYIK